MTEKNFVWPKMLRMCLFFVVYTITREEADEYERREEAARRHAAAQQVIDAASQYDPSYYYGYQPGQPWP